MGNRSTFVLNTPDEMQQPQGQPASNLNNQWLLDEERKARVNALRKKYDTENAVNTMQQYADAPMQAVSDVADTVAGWPEAIGTFGTGLLAQAGSGLGTAAGIVGDTIKHGLSLDVGNNGLRVGIKRPDMDAAAETIGENTERFTAAPRTAQGEQALRGIGAVMEPVDEAMKEGGQRVSEATGSPLAGALTYGGMQFLDPEHGAAVIGALKGSGGLTRLIREAGASPGISSAGRRGRQAGAWVPGDIADVEGDFSMRSPTVDAFTRLKPQEQTKLPGRQLAKALMREGAKKEELQWMGLDKVLDTDEVLSVADVKRLSEANEPRIEHVQARAGEGGELDEDAVNEAVSEAVSNDDDLRYPVTIMHREPGSRRYTSYDPASRRTFESEEEANEWLDEHKKELVEQETDYYLENIGEHFDEEQLAEMSDEQKQEWAESAAQSSVEDQLGDFEMENDYDNGAINEEELRDYHEQRIRDNPADYGLEGSGDAPDYGEYTVGKHGRESESSYTVAAAKLAGEARFGRNMSEPDFLAPYARAELAAANARNPDMLEYAKTNPAMGEAMSRDLADSERQMSLLPADQKSKAYQREALRRGQIAEDPNRSKYTTQSSLSHYRDLGKNQLYFTRETHRPAPDWGTVQRGVGRQSDTGLATAEGGELPPSPDDTPLAFLEEAQSDWYQKGRKTGWADPKDIEKVEKQRVDKTGQIVAFQQQAIGELDNLWRNPHVSEVVQRALKNEGPGGYLQSLFGEWHALQTGGALERSFDVPELHRRRIRAGRNILNELDGYEKSPEAAQLISQTRQGLDMVPNMTEIPGAEDLTPTGPMRETPQYTQLAMADALRRAVQEGKQYFGWTPADVHARRWGTESMQYAPSAENPRVMRARFGGAERETGDPATVMEQLQQRADELLGPEMESQSSEYNLDDPEIDKALEDAVERHLNYGMSDYPDPGAQRVKRAAGIRKDMEKLAAEAAAGNRRATHNSPRAHGYDSAYGPMEKHVIDILRRSGVKPPEIRDIMLRGFGKPMRGFEIDPDLARAAKRGFILPY